MIYSILKTIIDTTIVQYVCQACQSKIDENSVTIGQITEHALHLDIVCPHCQAHAHIHAEVAQVNSQIIHSKKQNQHTSPIPKNENAIKETDIQSLSESLKHTSTIEDLLL